MVSPEAMRDMLLNAAVKPMPAPQPVQDEHDFDMREAPCHYNNNESSAWASGASHGYTLGFRAALAAAPAPGVVHAGATKISFGGSATGGSGGISANSLAPVPAPVDACLVLWQAMNEAEKVGNRTDDKLVVEFLRRAGYGIAALAATPAPAPLALDVFDEHDLCNAWAGLPIEFFNPGPSFGVTIDAARAGQGKEPSDGQV